MLPNLFRYVSLPDNVSDKDKIKKYEMTVRLAYEYPAKILEPLLKHTVHYKILRFISKIGELSINKTFKDIQITNESIGGVSCRVYKKTTAKVEGAILYIHGGGFFVLRPKYFDITCAELADKTNFIVFSIDYSLSPEAPYKAALSECETVLKNLYEKSYNDYMFNKNKIIIFGESAGGNIAASLALRLVRDNKNYYFYRQILVNPIVSYVNYTSPSHQIYKNSYHGSSFLSPQFKTIMLMYYAKMKLSKEEIKKITLNIHIPKAIRELSYLSNENLPNDWNTNNNNELDNDLTDSELIEKMYKIVTDPDISPILADDDDLIKLQRTMIVTSGIDILRDEGFLFHRRLKNVGVDTTWKHYDNTVHGIISMWDFEMRNVVMNDIIGFIVKN
uniref:Abhydrolase_3 domain-containing protein n=1 Tax=Parastrongyloides trichosuri TaxID=131310 RepID=A0A0N4ZXH3_PARTI